MAINDALPRKLPYPLNRNLQNVGDTSLDTIEVPYLNDWASLDPSEKVRVSLLLSLDEWVILASSIDVGRDVGFSEESDAVWDLWSRVLASLDFCQDVADCILDPNSPAYDAVAQLAYAVAEDAIRAYAQSLNNANLAGNSNPDCDKDILFGQCLQLVEYLNQVNIDILEIFEVLTNPIEIGAQVIGQVTGLDEASVDALIGWVAFVQQNIEDNYLAQITQQYLEERACEIFCLALNNDCILDPDTLYTIWQDRLNSQVTIDGLIKDSLNYLISGIWTGTEIADFMFYSQLAFRSQAGKIIEEFAYNDIDFRLKGYSNDPDPDWQFLCTSCEWEYTIDFEDLPNEAVITWGEVLPDGSLGSEEIAPLQRWRIDITFPVLTNVTRVEAEGIAVTSGGQVGIYLRNNDDNALLASQTITQTGSVVLDGSFDVDLLSMRLIGDAEGGIDNNAVCLNNTVKFYGVGILPFT